MKANGPERVLQCVNWKVLQKSSMWHYGFLYKAQKMQSTKNMSDLHKVVVA